jgi:hypothetical protein
VTRIKKFSATINEETLATARQRVDAGLAPSFNAYVQRALNNENMVRTLDDVLRDLDVEFGPATQDATAWARQALGL